MKLIPLTTRLLGGSSLCLLALSIPSFAQESAPVLDIEARRESVVNLKLHVEQRQERIDDLTADIRSMDDRLEERIDKVLVMVGQFKDSNQSRTRVFELKADLIVGLKRTVEYYKGKQAEVQEQLKLDDSSLPKETLQRTNDVFNGRIEKRVEQILALAKTFPDPKELAKYETTSRGSWDSWGSGRGRGFGPNEQISEDWKHNRIESRDTDSAREEVVKGLQASMDYLKRSNDYMNEKLKDPNLSEAETALYESDLAQNDTLIKQREAQLENFLTTSPPETKALDRDSAHSMEELIRDSVADMRQDFFTIFQKYSELNKERAGLFALEENLDARIAWLADYDAKNPK